MNDPLPLTAACRHLHYRPYAYDVTEGRPAVLGVKRNTATCVIAKHAARGANPASHTAGLARPGPRTERLSANAHCQYNTCALRDTRLASLLWRCDPLWRQCIRSIVQFVNVGPVKSEVHSDLSYFNYVITFTTTWLYSGTFSFVCI